MNSVLWFGYVCSVSPNERRAGSWALMQWRLTKDRVMEVWSSGTGDVTITRGACEAGSLGGVSGSCFLPGLEVGQGLTPG